MNPDFESVISSLASSMSPEQLRDLVRSSIAKKSKHHAARAQATRSKIAKRKAKRK